MKLDAHQHFWSYDPVQYPWIHPAWAIRRDFLPTDLAPLLQSAGLEGSIAVQARQTFEESRWLLSLVDHHSHIRGVVGWVDLRSDRVPEQIEELAAHPKFVGVRHVVQDEPDDEFLLGTAFVRGLRQLAPFELTYDLLVLPKQLPAALKLVAKLPHQPFVLDHIAKPSIREGKLSPWRELITELAQARNVCCKVSGLVTEADWHRWKPQDFEPYLDVVFEAFGPNRLMFGSDWPVCLLAGSYAQVAELVRNHANQLTAAERELLFGGTAEKFYGGRHRESREQRD